MPTCLALLYAQTQEARILQYVISAFKDGIKLLKAGHAEAGVVQSYEKELEDAITDVRYHIMCTYISCRTLPAGN